MRWSPGLAPGTTFHADYFEAWDPTVKAMWTDNCINKMLNCSGGDLGNGKQLKGARAERFGWFNMNHLAAAQKTADLIGALAFTPRRPEVRILYRPPQFSAILARCERVGRYGCTSYQSSASAASAMYRGEKRA
jgi:hypothetical protein